MSKSFHYAAAPRIAALSVALISGPKSRCPGAGPCAPPNEAVSFQGGRAGPPHTIRPSDSLSATGNNKEKTLDVLWPGLALLISKEWHASLGARSSTSFQASVQGRAGTGKSVRGTRRAATAAPGARPGCPLANLRGQPRGGGGGRSSAGPGVPEKQLSSEAEHEGNKRGRRGHETAAGREARAKSPGPAQPHQAAAHLGLQFQSGCDWWDTRAR